MAAAFAAACVDMAAAVAAGVMAEKVAAAGAGEEALSALAVASPTVVAALGQGG